MGLTCLPDVYFECNSKGIFRVTINPDGTKTETSLTKEEYDKIYPKHKDTDCKECTFVQDKETILTFFVDRESRENVGADPKLVGSFCLPGFTGHLNFYLFRCPCCGNASVSYIHGVRKLGCLTCGEVMRLDPVRDKDIFIREGVFRIKS